MPARATAAPASPRTRWRSCAPASSTTRHLRIVEAVVGVNEGRKRRMVQQDHRRLRRLASPARRSPSWASPSSPTPTTCARARRLVIVPALQGEGATVRAFDPEGMREAAQAAARRRLVPGRLPRARGCRRAVILTEWNEFRGLDLERARELMRRPLIDRPAQHLRPGPGGAGRLQPTPASAGRRPAAARAERAAHAEPGHRFHPTLLREYDIRGIVGSTLHAADARAIGRAFGTMVVRRRRPHASCLGYDGRLSSPELAAAAARRPASRPGSRSCTIGLGPTPMMYFAVHHLGADGGMQITGSHNPPDYNGFKMMLGTQPFFGDQIQEIGRIAAAGAYADGRGQRDPRSTCSRPTSTAWSQDYHGTAAALASSGTPATAPPARPWRRSPPACPAGTSACSPRSTAASPTTTPTRPCPHNLVDLIREVTERRLRARHRLRRRRRPDRRRRRPGPDRLRRPDPADPGGRRAGAPPRRHDHRRRQDQPDLLRRGRAARRQAPDVEDRPLPDQGQDGRGRRAALGRDVRPHLLQGRLLRPRRRALRRRPPARHPGPRHRDAWPT